MKATITDRDYEILSAYMDGQLSPGERQKLEERMRGRPDLQAAFEDMRRMRALLRQAPRRRAPRNFTLTPAMVGERKPRQSPWANLFPAFSFTSALAALALVVLLSLQLGANRQAPQSVAMQPPAATIMMEAPAAQEVPAGAQEAAPQEPEAQEAARIEEPAAQAAATEAAAQEVPAATEEPAADQAAPKAAETAVPEESSMLASGAIEPTLPVVINWNGVPGIANEVMLGTGLGGGVDGRGGGGGEIYLPPDSVNSLYDAEAAPEAAALNLDTALDGPGPILGVPAEEDAGQIIEQPALEEQPLTPTPLSPAPMPTQPAPQEPQQESAENDDTGSAAASAATVEPEAEQPEAVGQLEAGAPESNQQPVPQNEPAAQQPVEAQPRTLLGMSPAALLVVEIVLGAITLAAGIAAWILWRQRR